MAAIFPPASQGGVPPGAGVANGFTPTHQVVGEGPLYVAPDCTTVLTDGQLNALTSEILAAVDELGYPYNSGRIDNLGTALLDRFAHTEADIATKVSRAGDTMEGPLALVGDPANDNDAANKRYVDAQDTAHDTAVRQYVDQRDAAVTAAFQAADSLLDERKVDRAGDIMTGPLMLARDPEALDEAATRRYVDARVARSGDTMTGPLILARDPQDNLEAATKQYVDAEIASAIPGGSDGGTSVGASPPTGANQGALWWDSNGGGLFVRFNNQWVQALGG